MCVQSLLHLKLQTVTLKKFPIGFNSFFIVFQYLFIIYNGNQ